MARKSVALGLTSLFVVFAVIILVLPWLKRLMPSVSGFENLTAQCQEGRTPCPEGSFCEQGMCVPRSPRYNVDQVVGQGS